MTARHFEFLAEEQSMEAFLQAALPRLLPESVGFHVTVFKGKRDLIRRLPERLRAFPKVLPPDFRIFVLVDRDNDDCRRLKEKLEAAAVQANLRTRLQGSCEAWQVVNRIVIEELEAWYFGDWPAVCGVWPKISTNVVKQARYRDPDAVQGGTWEAFERILQRAGYFKAGLAKIAAARAVGARIDPSRNRSRSFAAFRDALAEASG